MGLADHDDDTDLRELLVEELEDAGHQVLEAGNGVEGLAAIKAGDLDVIISDIGMPEMDGYQLRQCLETCRRCVRRRSFSCRLSALSRRSPRA